MVGQNIGKYRVLDRVGRGGMGTVYRAIDETLHREVAIKVLNAELNDPEVARRFRAEAITVARLSHPGIATIYELFQHEGQWLMVMEFVRGETLEHMVERTGGISPQRSAELCMQSLAALAHAHSMGVVHRDLKPANLMITETGAIKIMDFGIARVAGTEHLTNAGFMMGTPAYMAPEQVMGKEIDARADLYSLGVVFYRLTTAQLPFKGDTPFAMAQSQVSEAPTPIGMFRSDLPPWVEQVVVKALAKVPEERFQSSIEFHEAFARCLAGLPMLTSYHSSAPTELLTTPPRAMPTGGFYRSTTPSGYPVIPPTSQMPAPTATPAAQPAWQADMAPTMLSGSRLPPPTGSGAVPASVGAFSAAPPPLPPPGPPTGGEVAPGTGPVAVAPGTAPVAMALPGTAPVPVPTAPPTMGATATTAVPPATAAVPVAAPAPPRGNTGLILGAAAAVVLLAAGGGWWAFGRSSAPPPTEPVAAVVPEAVPVVPDPAAIIPATPSATAAPAAAPSATPAAPGATTGPGRLAGPASTTGTSAGPGTSAAARGAEATGPASAAGARGPVIDDTPVEVRDVKVLIIDGRKSKDQDVLLGFGAGQIALTNPRGGAPLTTLPYRTVTHATYIKARDPKWNEAAAPAAAPPKDLDVGSFMRTSKHWLVLQARDSYLILRLEDRNFQSVLQAVEARTGLTIDRPKSTDDKDP